jgi:hypothetical protein
VHRTVEIRLDYEDRAKEVTKSVTDTVILGNPGFDQEEIEKIAARAIQRLIMEGPGA